MRRVVVAVLAAVALLSAAPQAHAIIGPPPPPPPTPEVPARPQIPTLGWFVMGSVGCAAAAPIVGTIILGRELTLNEAYRNSLGCLAGPLGWIIADALVPPTVTLPTTTNQPPPRRLPPRQVQRGGNVSFPSPGAAFVINEILLEGDATTLARIAQQLRLTLLETQTFTLTSRTLARYHIDANRSVPATLRLVARFNVFGQANYLYRLQQPAGAANNAVDAQYVVNKLHLTEAHSITNGDDVLVAVIDSKIDTKHPDLAGDVAAEDDLIGAAGEAHAHGTGMAGAIAAHSKLVGVAPKVKLLAVRAFSGKDDTAQGTTFNILKGLDWAASQHARIVNMSFAGPPDAALADMLEKAHAHGMVLIAAVGNAGPRSPPLYPAAYREVIGVTATDADDKLLPQANRGPQVAVAAPGVQILAPAPDDQYQLTSGTSVAAAHVSGVVALMLARNPNLTPDEVRRRLIASAREVKGPKRDFGAGVIDALRATEAAR